ncbi:hypothetical protein [Streptomyces sp. NPDC007369]|uniref:hypothetical protein n=1 Tax=Streptomyces sp. NPDC007369 TaxID=3154589 RepID=UPI0033C0ECB7
MRRSEAHHLALAEHTEPTGRTAAQLPWIRRPESELDNPGPALGHAIGAGAQRLALALGCFRWLRDYRREPWSAAT